MIFFSKKTTLNFECVCVRVNSFQGNIIRCKMKLLVHPLKLMEILSFFWTGIKLFVDECYRYLHREEIVVKTKSGLVKGFKIASNFDYSYFNFIGIPYAKPPIGELRFMVCFFSYH